MSPVDWVILAGAVVSLVGSAYAAHLSRQAKRIVDETDQKFNRGTLAMREDRQGDELLG